jgi:hypothetical protein
VQTGNSDPWFTRRYIGTLPVLYPGLQLILLGSGPLVGLAGVGGLVLAAIDARRTNNRALAILPLAAIVAFMNVAVLETKWVRYLLPVVPYLCLGAVYAAWMLGKWAARTPALSWTRYAIFGMLILSTLLGALAFEAIYEQDHSIIQASYWIYNHLRPGSRIGYEANDGALPRALPGHTHPDQEYTLIGIRLLADQSSPAAFAMLHADLDQVDYLLVENTHALRTVSRLPWRYPVQIRYYDLLFSGQLGFVPLHTIAVYPTIFGHAFPDDHDPIDASFIEYDHPSVRIFRKQRTLTDSEWIALFKDAVQRPTIATRHPPQP